MRENSDFARKYSFEFSLLSDADRKVCIAYGACDGPKDEYARRIAYLIGPDGRIREAHGKVDASTYPKKQLESI